MSLKCLLCGHTGAVHLGSSCETLPCCSWCLEEARELHPREVSALIKLDQIKPVFSIWSAGRREDSLEVIANHNAGTLPVPQPARAFPGIPLYIGDMDDASDLQRLKELHVGSVVNLCAERIAYGYEHVPAQLALAGINHHILIADDDRDFDIMQVADHAFGAIQARLAASGENTGVLIHCWGGVNRSAAGAVAYLAIHCKVPLLTAIENAMTQRGTILTNHSFRKQLVRRCFKAGLDLGLSDVEGMD